MDPGRVLRSGFATHRRIGEARQCNRDLGVDRCRMGGHGFGRNLPQRRFVVEPVDGRIVAVDDAGRVLVDDRLGAPSHGARNGVLQHDEAVALEIAFLVVREPTGMQFRHGLVDQSA